jgi:uncharacterized protein YbbC (DUF1343 family)
MMKTIFAAVLVLTLFADCNSQRNPAVSDNTQPSAAKLAVGAERLDVVARMLSGKRVALVVNYTAMVGKTHLADTLKAIGVDVKKILAPEHGFRGTAAAGEYVKDGVDVKTGLPVVSLYGKDRKPTPAHLADIDALVFDIQDVGVRFFTYIGTLHYVMEAAAENNKEVIVLDRPNPNAAYIDGPILKMEFQSFIGMHPVPVVHGLTIGEFATMINGERWLEGGRQCKLEIVTMQNWKHTDSYSLPVKPSPNLPNDQAVRLYPSICFFEGTTLSLGRGTQMPFQIIGHPDLKNMPFQFTPITIEGMAKNPPQENKLCYGLDLRKVEVPKKIALHYLIDMYNVFPDKEKFFIPFFERLAGNAELRQQIKDGMSEDQIRATWEPGLRSYREMQKKYLLYP